MDVVDWPGVSGTITHRSPARAHLGGAHDRFLGIVAALHEDVRADGADQLERRVLVEHGDRVHALERREDIGALRFASGPGARGPSAAGPTRRC